MKAAFAVLLLCLLAGCGSSQDPAATRSSVLFFGDSIFGRWDLAAYFPGKGYINGGYFGQRTDQLLERLPDAVSGIEVCNGFDGSGTGTPTTLVCGPTTPPATVIIYAGWNNLFQATDPQQAVLDIDQMVTTCLRAGARPIVVTLFHFDPAHPPSWDPTFTPEPYGTDVAALNQGIRAVAKLHNIPVLDLEKLFSGESGYTEDGVHPVASGYQQMHDAVAPLLN